MADMCTRVYNIGYVYVKNLIYIAIGWAWQFVGAIITEEVMNVPRRGISVGGPFAGLALRIWGHGDAKVGWTVEQGYTCSGAVENGSVCMLVVEVWHDKQLRHGDVGEELGVGRGEI